MENKPSNEMKSSNDNSLVRAQLKIFFLIAFGLTLVMGVGIYLGKARGVDINSFASFQMFTPALGVVLAMLLTRKKDPSLPKFSFKIYSLLALALGVTAWLPIFLPEFPAYGVSSSLMVGGSVLFFLGLLLDGQAKMKAFGLNLGNVKKIFLMVGLFLLLYFLRIGLVTAVTEGWDSFLGYFTIEKLIILPILILNLFLSFLPFLGEEYGWRYFLQPILQKKFGMVKGILVLGFLWGIWHLPLNLFYYSAEGTGLLSLLNQIILCISYSFMFAFAYSYSGSIWTPTLIHYFNNNLILLFVDLEDMANPDILQNQEYTWESLGLMALANLVFFGIFVLAKRNRKLEFRLPTPNERIDLNKDQEDLTNADL